jgi:hypothetical protein
MNDFPDVAGSLFTTTYRKVKLAGQVPPPHALQGTGSVRTSVGDSRAQCLAQGERLAVNLFTVLRSAVL